MWYILFKFIVIGYVAWFVIEWGSIVMCQHRTEKKRRKENSSRWISPCLLLASLAQFVFFFGWFSISTKMCIFLSHIAPRCLQAMLCVVALHWRVMQCTLPTGPFTQLSTASYHIYSDILIRSVQNLLHFRCLASQPLILASPELYIYMWTCIYRPVIK